MLEWLFGRRRKTDAPLLGSRADADDSAGRIDLSDLAPDVVSFLGQTAYLELAVFESLSRAVSQSPNLRVKEGISIVAGEALAKHQGLIAELRAKKVDPTVAMQPFTEAIDRFEMLTRGRDWYETLLGVYITAGFLDDFFARLVGGLPRGVAARVRDVLTAPGSDEVILDALREGMASDPDLSSRLALWGRRLIGDTQLVARSAIAASDSAEGIHRRIEPVFTDLLGAHTRRMDALGLTA
ncbi:MAG: ferritin-like fold-containing protein [Actinobacteria bacterium]|nr:ferritin-like fold-containing protein [Actinomycetota bacterium]